MHTKEKIKMCPYCEGSIPVEALECRYCGSSLAKGTRRKMAYETEGSLASLYEPPYAPNRKPAATQSGIATENIYTYEKPEEPEETNEELIKPVRKAKKSKASTKKEEEEEKAKIGSLLLLSIGGNLFTLAWLQFFLSDHGHLTLEWKSRYWPIYLLASLPFLYHGYKKL